MAGACGLVPRRERACVTLCPLWARMYALRMRTLSYVHWQHESTWIGYLSEFPDYWSQGASREELEDNLRDVYAELTSGRIPEVRQVAELHIT